MSKIYDQLEAAALENRASDVAAATVGRIWWNTTEERGKIDDGSLVRALLRNDQKLVIGNNGTANNNIRLHRGASGVLQFLQGGDATAEGSLSGNLNQCSFKFETYTDAGKPAAGNAGRVIYISDLTVLKYDNGSTWLPIGSGGGGGSLRWVEPANSPTASDEFNNQVYLFQSGLAQELYAMIRVPNSYVAGSQINMRFTFYSPDNTGDALMQTVATLIRPGTDTIDSVTNQRTSTNAAVTLSAGTVNEPQAVVADLTSSIGQINGVAVSPGDLIQVKLTRGTDTATSDLSVLAYGIEVTFQ